MEGSKYQGDSPYLSSIVHKQERGTKPVIVEEVDTPLHFVRKNLSEEEQRHLLHKKIFENPAHYISTHVKCQICNRYIEIELANHHSKVHFEEEERVARILRRTFSGSA